MEIQPLFHTDLAELKSCVRLSGADEKADVQCVIEDCVRGFKVWLIQRAGFTIVANLQATPPTDDPTTELEARRLAAKVLEAKWVWCHLLPRLQTLFADASGNAQQEFNDQGVWRQMDALDLTEFLRRCEREVEELYVFVSGCQAVGESEEVQCFDGTPDSVCVPTGSAWPEAVKFPGNFMLPSVRFDEINLGDQS